MQKIVISANTSWYLFNFRRNTILELLKNGFSVIAVAPQDVYSVKLVEMGCQFIHINIDQGGTNPLRDVVTFLNFFNIYKKIKPDIILNFTPKNNIYSTLSGYLNKSYIINNIAGLGGVFVNENITSKIARWLYKISQSKANKIFFQNEEDRELFLKYKFSEHSVTERIPGSGVDLERFSLVPNGKNRDRVKFILIARMLYHKGILQYVDAARELKSKYGDRVHFEMLGFLDVDNPSAVSKNEMASWVEEGIVNYLGVSDNVENYMGDADCVVLPSYYREGVPKSLLEAGAMGKIIVTTDNVGCRETVEHGYNGFLCEPRSTESLILQLESVISLTPEQKRTMGENSRRKIELEFDEKIIIERYVSSIFGALAIKELS